MSFRHVIGRALVFVVLEIGALCGVPMDPVKVEELMKATRRSAVVQEQTSEGDDDPQDPFARSGG